MPIFISPTYAPCSEIGTNADPVHYSHLANNFVYFSSQCVLSMKAAPQTTGPKRLNALEMGGVLVASAVGHKN